MEHSVAGTSTSGSRATGTSVESPSSSAVWPHILRRGVGVFWILAGILQTQPLMFTPDFYAWYPSSIMESIVQTAADNQPHFVVATVHLGSIIWSMHPTLFNILAAILQLVIGVLLIFGRGKAQYSGLVLSTIWGSLVWITAEAFGGVFGGSTYFDGFPGAASLYVISSILLLIAWHRNTTNAVHSLRESLRYLVTIFWFIVAFLQMIPSSGFWQTSGLMEPFANEAAQPGPRFLAQPVQWFTFVVASHTALVNMTIVLIMVILAFLTLLNLWNRFTITLAVLWLLWSWWFGQGFGAIFTGAGTDVNSIPVIGLWMVCLWVGRRQVTRRRQ